MLNLGQICHCNIIEQNNKKKLYPLLLEAVSIYMYVFESFVGEISWKKTVPLCVLGDGFRELLAQSHKVDDVSTLDANIAQPGCLFFSIVGHKGTESGEFLHLRMAKNRQTLK